jgi:hypothetical protein
LVGVVAVVGWTRRVAAARVALCSTATLVLVAVSDIDGAPEQVRRAIDPLATCTPRRPSGGISVLTRRALNRRRARGRSVMSATSCAWQRR